MAKKTRTDEDTGYLEPLKSLGTAGLLEKCSQDRELGQLSTWWAEAVVSLCEAVDRLDPSSDEEAERACEIVYDYLNTRLGTKGTKKAFKYKVKAPRGAHMRQRYRDCRAEGMGHVQAIERMKQAVDWAIRFHGHEKNNWQWINPTTTFRMMNWESRR